VGSEHRVVVGDAGVVAALVVVSGLPGTGKSTVARQLAISAGAHLLVKDVVEAALRRRGVTRELGSSWAAHEVLTSVAGSALDLGQVVILDTVAGTEQVRSDWRGICSERSASFIVLVCECRDVDIHRARLMGRRRGIADWPELSWEDVEATRARWEPWPDEHLVIDAIEDLASNVEAATRYVEDQR
jgi:predicted kinase